MRVLAGAVMSGLTGLVGGSIAWVAIGLESGLRGWLLIAGGCFALGAAMGAMRTASAIRDHGDETHPPEKGSRRR